MPDDFNFPPAPAPTHYAAPPHQPRPGRSGKFWFFTISGAVLGLCLFFGIFVWAVFKAATGDSTSMASGDKIGVLDLDGAIMSADSVNEQLRKLADDDDVKAIVLHINSPGGGAAASQEIYNEVRRIRAEKKIKIVASIESMGASGAYYIASGCDKIYANDASVVGSIGVIMEWTNYGDLMRWAKMKNVILKAGELKDAGDPTRDLTPKEQAYFQTLVDNMHTQFIHDVAVGRGTSDDKIRPLATGQVWTGQQAKPLGLIDVEGGFRQAVVDTARAAGIKGEPNLKRPAKPRHGLLTLLAGDSADDLFPSVGKVLNRAPGFFYMWR